MENKMTGCFARSLAGHDKTEIYIIVGEEPGYVYLSDGKLKKVENPKKKKLKHILQIIIVKTKRNLVRHSKIITE